MQKLTMRDVRMGDVVRFKKHALRVEETPVWQGRRVCLSGRESRDGCPYVTRWYFDNVPCEIDRDPSQEIG